MRLLIFCILISFTLSGRSGSKPNPSQTLWMTYTIKKGEWIYNIARKSALVQSQILSLEKMVSQILSRNPQLKNPDYVESGQEILLPISVIPQLEKDQIAAVVNYNFYFNSQIYNYPPVSNQLPAEKLIPPKLEFKERQPSTLSVQNTTRIESQRQQPIQIKVGTKAFYSLLESETKSNSAIDRQASVLNYGVDIELSHHLSDRTKMYYVLDVSSESYDIGNQTLFGMGTFLGWSLFKNFSMKLGGSFIQSQLLVPTTGVTQLSALYHPRLNLGVDYLVHLPLQTNLNLSFSPQYLLNASKAGIALESGVNYKFYGALSRMFFGYNWTLSAWGHSTSMVTNLTKQTSKTIGTGLYWSGSF